MIILHLEIHIIEMHIYQLTHKLMIRLTKWQQSQNSVLLESEEDTLSH